MLTELSCYRSLICRLEEVDPRKLKNDEKLAFWINVHNTLVMHVMFTTCGIPISHCGHLWLVSTGF